MKCRADKSKYRINFCVGIILSLTITIAAFLISPQNVNQTKKNPYFAEPIITLIDIPNTRQYSGSAAPPSAPIITSMLEPIEEPEMLPDVFVKEAAQTNTGEIASIINTTKNIDPQKTYEASSFPFVPRQVLEVVPNKIDDIKGFIKVRVLIDEDGKVKKHEIMNNTTNSIECLANVQKAIYKSRWQPIKIENQPVEYWIEKTYSFN
jgi:hypothetical protein